MQVFKAFMKVLRKNLFTALVFTGVFLFLAFYMAANSKYTEPTLEYDQRISYFDLDNSPESRKFAELLEKRFKVKTISDDKDVITDMLYYETTEYALEINKGFGEKLAAGETTGLFSSYHLHDSYSAVIVEQFLEDYAQTMKAYTSSGFSVDRAMELSDNDIMTETEVKFETFTGEENAFPFLFQQFYRYLPYILISAILSALCPVLMIMNRKDMRFRTNCSSISQNTYNAQIFAGGAVFVFVMWLIFTAAGMITFGGIFEGRAWIAVLNSGIFALITTSLAVLIASLISSQKILTLIVQILGLGMSFICGIFVPQSMLGNGVNAVGRFFPTYWYIRLNDMISGNRVYSSEKAAMCLGIQIAYLAAILLVTVLIRRLRYSGSSIATTLKKTAEA